MAPKSAWIEKGHVEKKAKGNWYKSICRNTRTENNGKTQRFKRTRNIKKSAKNMQDTKERSNLRKRRGRREGICRGEPMCGAEILAVAQGFFLKMLYRASNRASKALVRIESDFQRRTPIACQFSRGTPGEHGVG